MYMRLNTMSQRFAAMMLIALSVLTSAHAAEPVDKGPLLATVADKPIYTKELVNYAKANPLMTGYITHEAGLRRVLDDMINYRLLLLEGDRENIVKEPDESEDRYIMRVKGKLVQKCERLDEAGSKAFFEAHPELFSTPAYARLSKAYLKKSDKIDGMSAVDFMNNQAAELRSGNVEFDALVAKIRPLVPSDVVLGDIGFMPLAEIDPIISLVSKANVGDVVGPVERGGNIFVFLVTERRQPIPLKWEDVLASAQEVAYSHCMQDNFAILKKNMEERFPVQIQEENIRTLKYY